MTKLEIYHFVSLYLMIVKLIRAFVKTLYNCVLFIVSSIIF